MQLLENAVYGNPYIMTFACYDEASTNIVPTTASWTLKNRAGTIINSRENVSITPALTMTVVLTQADLAIGTDPWRVVEFSGTYSSSYGTGLPLFKECTFKVREDD